MLQQLEDQNAGKTSVNLIDKEVFPAIVIQFDLLKAPDIYLTKKESVVSNILGSLNLQVLRQIDRWHIP